MINKDKVDELTNYLYMIEKLKRIAKTLHRLDEGDCNGRSERGEKLSMTREKNLMKEAQRLAETLGLEAFHQGDPRGCSLYLIVPGTEDQYSMGVAFGGWD